MMGSMINLVAMQHAPSSCDVFSSCTRGPTQALISARDSLDIM